MRVSYLVHHLLALVLGLCKPDGHRRRPCSRSHARCTCFLMWLTLVLGPLAPTCTRASGSERDKIVTPANLFARDVRHLSAFPERIVPAWTAPRRTGYIYTVSSYRPRRMVIVNTKRTCAHLRVQVPRVGRLRAGARGFPGTQVRHALVFDWYIHAVPCA
ncbi:hypothetical protein BC628DRAFT_858763 [Trametes gibbosa]|nr:hypothetical protein BC628DRAFT_858763 [Trametes gibbosa]